MIDPSSAIDLVDATNRRGSRNAAENDHLDRTLGAVAPTLDADESRLDPAENK